MLKDPTEQLRDMPSVQSRVDAIAEDIKRAPRARRYVKVPVWTLAEDLLEIELEQPDDGASTQMYWRRDLDDEGGELPAFENLEFLRTIVSDTRFGALSAQGQRITSGRRSTDLRLTSRETRLLEDMLALRRQAHAYLVNTYVLTATDGTDIWFEAIQGDGGEISDLVGPYELHDKGSPKRHGVIEDDAL